MVKESIYIKDYGKIPVEYDETKYRIDCIDKLNVLTIHRLSDNKIIYISNPYPTYAVQIDLDKQTHFVIGNHKEHCNKLCDYILDDGEDYVRLKDEFETEYWCLDDIRIGNHTFKVEDDHYSARLYNLKDLSELFDRIYMDNKMLCKNNIILVEKRWFTFTSETIEEKIRYFIDVDTLECVSPIHSTLQNRFIPIYTKQEIKEKAKQLEKLGKYLDIDRSPFSITEDLEIIKYYQLLISYVSGSKIYNDIDNDTLEIKEDYVRKFGLKK